jgi:hypothetical protein
MQNQRAVTLSLTFFLAIISCVGTLSPAWSRPWKPTSITLAEDYARISDHRANGDIVIVWWFVPRMMPGASEAFDKYVVIAVVHAHMGSAGTMSFQKVDTLQARDDNEKELVSLTGDSVPPVLTGILARMGVFLRHALGAMGEGTQLFVFNGGAVHSCGKGGMSIPYAGEIYTYETPIPGCSQQ